MSGYSRSPRLVKGAIVLADPASGAVRLIVILQYNPDTLSRTLQIQASGEGGARSEALRLAGPPIETIKLEADIDATDQLELPDTNADAIALGIHPRLAAMEALTYPTAAALTANDRLASSGSIEIVAMESDLALFVWSARRIVPVRITEFSIVEEAFDPALNPIRAHVSLGMRVLSVDDLGFGHRGGSLFMAYLKSKERIAGRAPAGSLSNLGIGGLP